VPLKLRPHGTIQVCLLLLLLFLVLTLDLENVYIKFTVVAVRSQTFYGRKPQGLNGALQEVGITFEGREHSGNIAVQLLLLLIE